MRNHYAYVAKREEVLLSIIIEDYMFIISCLLSLRYYYIKAITVSGKKNVLESLQITRLEIYLTGYL